jgi:hypothetical protein
VRCLVCQVSWPDARGSVCPQCGYDHAAAGAKQPLALEKARASFRDQTSAFAPETRVRRWDKLRPWVGVLLGFLLFVLWMRACSSGGFRF